MEIAIIQPMTIEEARQCADRIKTAITDIRELVLEFYEREGWRALGYVSWRKCVTKEFGHSTSRLYQLLDAARIERNISSFSTIVEKEDNTKRKSIPESHLRPLAHLEPKQQAEIYQEAIKTAPKGGITANHIEATIEKMTGSRQVVAGSKWVNIETGELIVNDSDEDGGDELSCFDCVYHIHIANLGDYGENICMVYGHAFRHDALLDEYTPYRIEICEHFSGEKTTTHREHLMSVIGSSETPEWYTPPKIIERTIKTMGKIDLDPCSNSKEKPNVPAKHHLTIEDNGLAHPWLGRIYMNPPYGREIAQWIEYLCQQYDLGNVIEAIALVPSRTDTEWFRKLRNYPRCFVWGRLHFSGHSTGAPFPSMAVYLGKSEQRFIEIFSDIGDIYTLTK